jgi:hypothetical protein
MATTILNGPLDAQPKGRPKSSRGRGIGKVSLLHTSDQLAKGRAWLLCGVLSDIDLFGYGKGVVDFDTEVAHRALDVLMP